MSQEQIFKTLSNLGFDQVDSQIYVYLAKKGMRKASEICRALKLTKQQLYPSIKRLQGKGIVSSTIEHPARFSVMPFEKVLDMFIKARIKETQLLQESKAEILSNWQNLKLEDETSAKFTVIEGRTFIYSKIQQMIQEAKNQVLAITTVPTLAQADQRDVFETLYSHSLKSNVKFRFLAELSEQNVRIMKVLLKDTLNAKLNVDGRNPDLGLTLFPQMLVRDEEEALFFTKPRTETSIIEKDDVTLWTDCKPLVKAFTAMFEELWHNSTSIQEKIAEIETGEPAPKTLVIEDAEKAEKKYRGIVNSAKIEVLIMTSSKGLLEFSKNIPQLEELTRKGVNVKIMAPIVSENLEPAKKLSHLASVKHVPPNYLQTTIVDGKHLFQLKTLTQETQPLDSSPNFENTLYTNNAEYVQKTNAMLNEHWKNARQPLTDDLELVLGSSFMSQGAYSPGAIRGPGPSGKSYPVPPDAAKKDQFDAIAIVDEDPAGKLTEQDVLKEIMHAQRILPKSQLGVWKVFSSQATAIIYPPDFFILPPMLIRIHHVEKHSTWGPEDVILINLWLETPNGHAYVPVAVLCDNLNAKAHWKVHFGNMPASQNIQLAEKEELQIRVHGNTLFAGWTVPIPLFPSQYVLPPGCLLIEGYGPVKTESFSIVQPTGGRFTVRQNGFDAFVTFIHPSSKYSGAGTDGFLVRDYIMEGTPKFFEGYHPTLETNLTGKNKS